jgi:hypothetical protein
MLAAVAGITTSFLELAFTNTRAIWVRIFKRLNMGLREVNSLSLLILRA